MTGYKFASDDSSESFCPCFWQLCFRFRKRSLSSQSAPKSASKKLLDMERWADFYPCVSVSQSESHLRSIVVCWNLEHTVKSVPRECPLCRCRSNSGYWCNSFRRFWATIRWRHRDNVWLLCKCFLRLNLSLPILLGGGIRLSFFCMSERKRLPNFDSHAVL